MARTIRVIAAVAVASMLSLSTVGCGSSGSASKGAGTESSTSTPQTTKAPSGSDTTTSDSTASSKGNPAEPKLADGKADAAHTVTYTAEKTWDPAKLTVAKGDLVTFIAAPGAPTAAVTFNGNDSYTITSGLHESFTFEVPGTYSAKEYVTGAPMTIVVTG